MTLTKAASVSVFTSSFKLPVYLLGLVLLLTSNGCKDIVFNNPLDPNASKETVKVILVIDSPLSGPGDLTYDGEKFWKINPYGNLSAFDRQSGAAIRSFFTSGGTGITFYNGSIYICNGETDNQLIQIDPLSGDTLNRIATGDLYPAFLASSTGLFIVYDIRSSGLFQYDPDSGSATRLFEVSGLSIGGIAMYKGGLLITDMNTDTMYRFKLDGSVSDVYTSPASGIGGLAVDSSNYVYLFILDGNVYKVSLP